MNRGGRAVVAAGVLALALGGPAGARAVEPEPFVHGGPLVSEVVRRFGEEVRILSLEIWPEEAFVSIQVPGNPAHVDRYGYRDGTLTGPEPVAVGRNLRQIRARVFRLRDVDLEVLRPALKAAPAIVRAEEGRVTHALVERSEGWSSDTSWGRPRWRVHVEGPRGGGYVEYRLDGRRGRVVRW
jgi:hypothetical protein